MKILNRKDFMTLGSGVIYSVYEPDEVHGLYLKLETLHNDWVLIDLIDARKSYSSDLSDLFSLADNALETGGSLELSYDSSVRDGLYEEGDSYAVYEKNDLENLIAFFSGILEDYPKV